MSHKIIRINSEERLNAAVDTSSRFRVSFANTGVLAGVNKVVVKSVSIPFVQYNVKTGATSHSTTNTFTFFDGAVNQTITIAPGFYSTAQLIAALIADAKAIAVGLAITLSATTGRLTFTTTAPVTFLSTAAGNNMARLLGITASSGAAVTTFTPAGFVDLEVHPNIYLASEALGDGSAMLSPTLGSLPVFAVVPIDVLNWGDMIQYRANQDELEDTVYPSLSQGKSLNMIDLSVYDGDAELIDLKGLDWTLILKVTVTSQ